MDVSKRLVPPIMPSLPILWSRVVLLVLRWGIGSESDELKGNGLGVEVQGPCFKAEIMNLWEVGGWGGTTR